VVFGLFEAPIPSILFASLALCVLQLVVQALT
jgi:hypothetical protein